MALYVALQIFVTLLCAVIFSTAVSMRNVPKSTYYIFSSVAVFAYALGYLYELTAPSTEAAIMAIRLQYVGIPFIAPLQYMFVRRYCNHPPRKKWVALLVFAPAILVALAAQSYPVHRWLFRELVYTGPPLPHIELVPGPLYWLVAAYSAFFLLASLYMLIRNVAAADKAHRKNAGAMLVLFLPALAFLLTHSLNIMPWAFNFTPLALVINMVMLEIYILRFQMHEWLPYVRDMILEKTQDAFILLDIHGCYLDANSAGYEIFPELAATPPGTHVSRIRSIPNELFTSKEETDLVTLPHNGAERVLRFSRTPIHYVGRVVCHSIMLYDVTEQRRLMQQLHELATHDTLTGLLNRGTFLATAQRDFELALRNRDSAAILMLDLDYFKRINDTYGHQCGDRVLERTAALLKTRLRGTDICGRYGGEELIVFLPGAAEQGARQVAQGICHAVADNEFSYDGVVFHVTLSIGVSLLIPDRTETLDAMISQADTALYTAKNTGRNKVCFYAPPGGECASEGPESARPFPLSSTFPAQAKPTSIITG